MNLNETSNKYKGIPNPHYKKEEIVEMVDISDNPFTQSTNNESSKKPCCNISLYDLISNLFKFTVCMYFICTGLGCGIIAFILREGGCNRIMGRVNDYGGLFINCINNNGTTIQKVCNNTQSICQPLTTGSNCERDCVIERFDCYVDDNTQLKNETNYSNKYGEKIILKSDTGKIIERGFPGCFNRCSDKLEINDARRLYMKICTKQEKEKNNSRYIKNYLKNNNKTSYRNH